MTWRPENGWPWLVGRWAGAAGAGAVLGGALWFGEPGSDRTLDLEPTATREVVLDPQVQAELSSLVPDARVPDDLTTDVDEDERPLPDDADRSVSDKPPPNGATDRRDDLDDGDSNGGDSDRGESGDGGTGESDDGQSSGADSEAARESGSADSDDTDREPAESDTDRDSDSDRDVEDESRDDEEGD